MCLYVSVIYDAHPTPFFLIGSDPMDNPTHFGLQPDEYSSGGDLVTPQVNGHYASSTGPSELAVGYNAMENKRTGFETDKVMLDSYVEMGSGEVGSGNPTETFGVPYFGMDARPDMGSGGEENYISAYASCVWLRPAMANETLPGSECYKTYKGQYEKGFIFKDFHANLQCAFLAATASDPDGYVNYVPYAKGTAPCPQGVDVNTLDYENKYKKRMPTGGCLDWNDSNYDPRVDYHVPGSCASHFSIIMGGCPMPLASNYDPSAKTPTTCSYETAGCTDSTAHNYNSGATVDDGSCIERVAGCNLPGSELADPSTSEVGTIGSATTVVTGCVIKVAGCMSDSSPNYNPNANVDSGTCTTTEMGCMLATSSNYDANATRDGGCAPRYPGCTNPAALNYKTYYNFDDGSCVLRTPGCKNKNANNYDASANTHFGFLCTFSSASPPSPPAIPGTTTREVYPVALAAKGISPAACNDTSLTSALVESFQAQAGADEATLLACTDVAVGGGSGRRLATGAVDLDIKLEYSSTESRTSGVSAAAAITTLTVAGEALVVTESFPAILPVETVQVAPGSLSPPPSPPPDPSSPPAPSPPPAPPSAPPSPLPLGAIIGGAAGGVVVIVGIAIGIYCVRKKRSSKPVAVA